jgi:hypothetical protein
VVTTNGKLPAAGIDGFGRFVVAWEDPKTVWVQRFEPDGSPLGVASTINDANQTPFAWDAAVAMGATGEFLVVAHASDPNDVALVIGQYFEADGTSSGPMTVGTADPGSSVEYQGRHPAVAMAANHVVTAWTLDFGDTLDRDVVARTFVSEHVTNTPAGTDVAVTPASLGGAPVSLTFSSVSQPGDTVLRQGSTGPAPPADFRLGDPPVYYELSTTAVFSGPVRVCIRYTGVTFTGVPVLFHFENGAWVALPNATVDPVAKVVCAETNSFSPFALMAAGDDTPPIITATVTGAAGDNGWYRSDVTVTWSVSDPDSAISSRRGCDAVTVASDTAGTTITCTAASAGGEASDSVTLKRDATPPGIVMTAPAEGAAYELNQALAASYACTDDLSGAALCLGPVPSGSGIDTSSPGHRTFTVTATDQAGNAALRSVTYEVRAACHYLTLGLSPSTVPQGAWTTVSTTLRSCAATAQRVAIRFVLQGAGGGGSRSILFTTPPFTLPPGIARTVSFPFRVPSIAPPGDYSVTATTLVNGTAADTTTAALTVVRR